MRDNVKFYGNLDKFDKEKTLDGKHNDKKAKRNKKWKRDMKVQRRGT